MKTIAIIGAGLIGGSFALAVRQAGFAGEIVGVSSLPTINEAIQHGVISRGVTLQEAAASADLLYLAQPIDRILKTIPALRSVVRPQALITDAGSTKVAIVNEAANSGLSQQFVGGHPLAGKEQRGVRAADPNLFRNRPYVLTPAVADVPLQNEFTSWLEKIGARVLTMSPSEHDRTVAFTSHLPQLLSTALAATLHKKKNAHIEQVFGPGLLDMTRLALSSSGVWESVVTTNKADIQKALDDLSDLLVELKRGLQNDNLTDLFASGAAFASKIRKPPLLS